MPGSRPRSEVCGRIRRPCARERLGAFVTYVPRMMGSSALALLPQDIGSVPLIKSQAHGFCVLTWTGLARALKPWAPRERQAIKQSGISSVARESLDSHVCWGMFAGPQGESDRFYSPPSLDEKLTPVLPA